MCVHVGVQLHQSLTVVLQPPLRNGHIGNLFTLGTLGTLGTHVDVWIPL